MQTSAQVVAMVRSTIERNQALLVDEIKQKQEAAERRADELLKDLQQETDELQRRRSELQHLEQTVDPLHLIQVNKTLKCPLFMFSSTLDCLYQRYIILNNLINANTIPDKTVVLLYCRVSPL